MLERILDIYLIAELLIFCIVCSASIHLEDLLIYPTLWECLHYERINFVGKVFITVALTLLCAPAMVAWYIVVGVIYLFVWIWRVLKALFTER